MGFLDLTHYEENPKEKKRGYGGTRQYLGGHSLSGTITTTVYTHYSEEFQLREAEKVDYLNCHLGAE